MKILNLYDKSADFANCGGKADGLHKLAAGGFKIPQGFVLTQVDLNTHLAQATEAFASSGITLAAVRSSASNEDGVEFSSAGQYQTVLNVTAENFENAVRECVQSLNSERAQSYSAQFAASKSGKMNVVVQQMVQADFAGVCFTQNPQNSEEQLVEIVEGLGESLVSGVAQATRFVCLRNSQSSAFDNLPNGLNGSTVCDIFKQALQIEQCFGQPLDLEFAIEKGEIFWLQARPITVHADDQCDISDLDPKFDMTGMTITRCNIGEMLPGAVTPLTISTNVYAIDYGMREMLKCAGILKSVDQLPEYFCAMSISNHLFMNLSSIYTMDGMVVGAKKAAIELSICGRVLDTPYKKTKRTSFLKQLNNGRKYFGFLFSYKKACREIDALANNIKIESSQNTPQGLYKAIDQNLWKNNRAMTLHYVTSSQSGAMSSALIMTLNKKLKDDSKTKAIVAEVLENIDGIESVDILRSLRSLSREMLSQNPNVANFSEKQIEEYLAQANGGVAELYASFMSKHGHRTIREAEMRNKGWADDRQAFFSYLKTVIASGGAEFEKKQPTSVKQILKKHGFNGLKAASIVPLCNLSRSGVVNREFSKSRIIKVMDAFKKAYARLAKMLVDNGVLFDNDLIYFLTHKEIGDLVLNNNLALVKKAIKRRRLLDEQSMLCFEEVNVGKPQAIEVTGLADNTGAVLVGTPISRGIVKGSARVVKNEKDAKLLEKGEIMVASFTDIGWSPYYCLISGLITEVGSVLSHGAVVAREYSLPLVANVANATRSIRTGDQILLNANTGQISLLAE